MITLPAIAINVATISAFAIEYIGIAIVIISALLALVHLLSRQDTQEQIRQRFGKRVLLGLEFIIAADVIFAVVVTEFNDLIKLGAVVVIRAILGFVLLKEIEAKG